MIVEEVRTAYIGQKMVKLDKAMLLKIGYDMVNGESNPTLMEM